MSYYTQRALELHEESKKLYARWILTDDTFWFNQWLEYLDMAHEYRAMELNSL